MTTSTSLTAIYVPQAVLSAFALWPAYQSITRTQTYESQTEKVAKYSNIADWHLWKTRKTLGGGTVGILASLVTSLSLLTTSGPLSSPSFGRVLVPAVLTVALTLSHTHVSNYWRGKAKVPLPGTTDYNNAIDSTALMRKCIGFLALSWGLVSTVEGWKWISG